MPIGYRELAWIILVVVILFGAKRIPDAMRSLGSGFREFKKGISGDEESSEKKKEQIEDKRD